MQYWKQQEYRVRDILRKQGWEAYRVPSSGASELAKGDVEARKANWRLIIDHKSTRGKESITLKRKDLEKIIEQAKDKIPIVTFSFLGHRRIFSVIDLERLLEILEEVRDGQGRSV
jgi:Holliday junction resolvase